MALNHLDRDRRGGRPAQGLESAQQSGPAVRREQSAGTIRANVATQRPQVVEHALRILPGELQALSIHDRVGKACLDQRIAQVMQVGQSRQGKAQGGKLAQRVYTQCAEHHQPPRANHAVPLADHGGNIVRPVQHQVRPDQIDLMTRYRQGMSIGADPGRPVMVWLVQAQAAGQGLPPGPITGGLIDAIANRQAPRSQIDSKQPGARVTLPECPDILAKTAADIHDESGLLTNKIKTLEHSLADFTRKKSSRIGPGRATVELPTHGVSISVLIPGRMA